MGMERTKETDANSFADEVCQKRASAFGSRRKEKEICSASPNKMVRESRQLLEPAMASVKVKHADLHTDQEGNIQRGSAPGLRGKAEKCFGESLNKMTQKSDQP